MSNNASTTASKATSKAKSKSAKVRDLIHAGRTVPEIVRATKASPQLVYVLRAKIRKEQTAQGIAAIPKTAPPIAARNQGIAGLRSVINQWPANALNEITEVVTHTKPTLFGRIANAWRRLWK